MEWIKNRRVQAIGAGVLLTALLGGGIWILQKNSADPEVARLQSMGREMMQQAFSGEPNADSFEKFRQFGQEIQELPPDKRRELMKSMRSGNSFREQVQAQMNQFFSLPKGEQVAFLDKQIDRMESFQDMGRMARQAGATFGPRRQRQRPARPNPEKMKERMRAMLDRTKPDDRAKMSELSRRISKRREERGLPPMRMRPR